MVNVSQKRRKEFVLGKVAMNQLLCGTAAAAVLLLLSFIHRCRNADDKLQHPVMQCPVANTSWVVHCTEQ